MEELSYSKEKLNAFSVGDKSEFLPKMHGLDEFFGVRHQRCRLKSVVGPSAWAIEVREADMTRAELDAALARLGLAVPEGERDQIVAAAHLIEDMVARLQPGRRPSPPHRLIASR